MKIPNSSSPPLPDSIGGRKGMRWVIVWLLLISNWSLANASPGIQIFSPADKTITFEKVIILSGKGKALTALGVNGHSLKWNAEGKFSAGIVLQRGKNLVEIKARDKRGQIWNKKIRILKQESFPDLTRHWAKNKIVALATLGFVEGYPDGNFYPSEAISRGELATWLARVKNLSRPTLTKDPFADVPKEHWRASSIVAAVRKDYFKEVIDKYFGVDDPILRANAAALSTLAEELKILGKVRQAPFRDVSKEASFAPSISTAKKHGLLIGVSKKAPLFEPQRSLTRAEAATLLSRYRFSQKAIGNLFDFQKGFTSDVLARINIAPEIEKFYADPVSIYANYEYIVKLRVKVSKRRGFYPLSKVKVDLSAVGGIPDAEMFDDGTSGDEVAKDGIYSLNLKLTLTEPGEKIFKVTVLDTLGWEGEKSTKFWVVK